MTPERWRQITEIFHGAREQPASARSAWLDRACVEDSALRIEVDRMLAAHDAGGTIDLHVSSQPRLSPGETIGPYRVEALIGAGGMGEVYRATDMRLRRSVALKILAPAFAGDPEWINRFTREAQALAALDHPHIGAIHGIEDRDGLRALVLEYIDGRSLDAIIAERGRSQTLESTLTIARQIALALEAAHSRGIVHRDLKPANVRVTPAGVVKVLDFGIAKSGPAADGDRSNVTQTATQAGIVLGTAAYMSPEQTRGQAVDRRTDIWAFGCVLFEMLSGRRAFDADTRSDTTARVLERDPDWSALPSATPPAIVLLLRRCLRKDPAARLHDIADARIEIDDALAPPGETAAATASTGRDSRLWMWTTAALATVVLGGIWWMASRPREPESHADAVEFGISFPDNHIPSFGLAIAPDSRQIVAGVFESSSQLFTHDFASRETRPVPGTGGGGNPFWSPDGSNIGYFTGLARELRVVTVASGAWRTVCPFGTGGSGGSWNRDGTILFGSDRQLFTVPATGGTPVALRLDGSAGVPGFPQFLPDQEHFIYYAADTRGGSVMFGSIRETSVTRVVDADSFAVFVEPNWLLFVRGAALVAQSFDPVRGVASGEPHAIVASVAAGAVGTQPFIAATRQMVAYATPLGGSVGRLVWFDRSGKAIGTLDEPADSEYLNPALSPDGKHVAANRLDRASGNWDVWVVDSSTGLADRLTTDPARDADPIWSPDGTEVVFSSDRDGIQSLYRKTVGGSARETRILQVANVSLLVPSDWSHDKKYILYSQHDGPGPWSVWALPLFGDQTPIRVIDATFSPYGAHLSPDGHWLAYSSFETKRSEVHVQRFLEPGDKKRISSNGGVHPRWTRNGHELVFWAVPQGIDAVEFNATGTTFTVGPVHPLVQAPVLSAIDGRTHYDITPDGARLLVRQRAGPQGPGISVILNWMDRLKR
jgi:eukaryotic-like serine/threonine-protein kinase